MKTRYEYIRQYLIDYEDYIDYIAGVCRDAGYSSIDEAFESIMKHSISDENAYLFNGWNSEEDYWIMTLIEGIYEYEKQLIRAYKRYDEILEKLAEKKKLYLGGFTQKHHNRRSATMYGALRGILEVVSGCLLGNKNLVEKIN